MSGVFGEIKEIFRYHELLRNLVLRDIKVRYKRSVLGFLWMMLNPLLIMLVLTLVFSEIFKFRTENYTVYVLSGIIFWNFFSQSTAITVKSFIGNVSLIKKVAVPRSIFPFSTITSALVNFLFALIPLYLVVFLSGASLSSSPYLILISVSLTFVFAFGLSLMLATLAVFFHDTVHIYDVLLFAWMYATPIFYPHSVVPEKYRFVLEMNPLYHLLNLFRGGLYMDVTSLSVDLAYGAVFSLITLFAGWGFYLKNRHRMVYYL